MTSTCFHPGLTNDTACRERVCVATKEINEALENLWGDLVAQSEWKRLNSFSRGVSRLVELSFLPLEAMD